jgi:hypothetical protein
LFVKPLTRRKLRARATFAALARVLPACAATFIGTDGNGFNPATSDSRAIKLDAHNPATHTLGFGLAGSMPAISSTGLRSDRSR